MNFINLLQENKDMEKLSTKDLDYFRTRVTKAATFCSRFPEDIDFNNKTVLDIGCGHGALSILAAQRGASKVLGIDVVPRLITFAKTMVKNEYSEIDNRLTFLNAKIEDLNPDKYDVVISQATMEHVSDPQSCLSNVKMRLNTNGKFYLGFGPLFNAPYGDHRLLKIPLQKLFPWAHCLSSQKEIIRQYNKMHPEKNIQSLNELGLNGLSYKQYETIIANCDLNIDFYQVNRHSNPLVKLINLIRCVPFLREYLSINVYVILTKSL